MVETETYGKKIEYDPLWRGPMDKERSPTDVRFLVSLGIFCALWLGTGLYAFSNGDFNSLPSNFRVRREAGFYYDSGMNTIRYENLTTHSYSEISQITLLFVAVSAILCVSYIILLRWFAKLIVYTAIALVFLLLFVGFCISSSLYSENNNRTDALAGLIFCIIVFFCLTITFLLLRKKINIACEVIRESSKAVIFFPSTLLFPFFIYILYIIVISFSGTVLVCLSAIPYETSETPGHIKFFHAVNIFGFLWLGGFVTAFSQMILSGTFATWYWSLNKQHVPNYTIVRFMNTAIRNHLGTLAFGSLILAICQVIKSLLNFIKKRLQGSCNPLACLCFGWYERIFGTLEKIIRYINRNAYIMCAIHGTNFFQSAKDAFNLLMRNIVKVFVIDKVTDVILILGQLLTISLSVLGAWKYCEMEKISSNDMSAVLGVVAVFSFLLTISFFMVLKTAIDTIFLSVLEDFERNDGTDLRPYYMSFKLKTLLLLE